MTEDMERQLRDFFESGIPFNAFLGMKIAALGNGSCTLVLPFREELVGDHRRGALHGGVLSTLADTAGGLAVFTTFDDPGMRTSTVDLRVDYLRPGRLEDLYCDAKVIRSGNRVAATSMVLRQGEHVPAECRGVYNVVRRS